MTIALIAGKGTLPRQIVQACPSPPLHIIGFEGQTPVDLYDHITLFPLGNIGKILAYLHHHHIKQIIFAGALERPSLSTLQLDKTGIQWLTKLGWRALKGDNDLLAGILTLLEQEGFEILKPSDFLNTLLAPAGCLTTAQPTAEDLADIQRGKVILEALAPYDVGQAIIIQQGLVLGIEAIEGTARLIERCGLLKRAGVGGVLVKMAKSDQDHRIDLPTIGPQTIDQLKVAGLVGVAIEAGTTQILDKPAVINKANDLGLFIIGIH